MELKRELGVFDAVMLGLGSIVGTGVFVSIGVAAGVTGSAVVFAIAIAALVATCNGLSSAQLAANHPVSGGTYEYGYRYLTPTLGFTAGWMFLCAKSASAATAALGFAGYLLHAFRGDDDRLLVPIALGGLIVLTILTLTGIRRSSRGNILIVLVTLGALATFVIAGLPSAARNGAANFEGLFDAFTVDSESGGLMALLHATALMFVAYTGYGRIATLGEEVREPRRTIPRAIIATLLVSMVSYMVVGVVAIGAAGATMFAEATTEDAAPLEIIARTFDIPGVPIVLAVGAITAMLGVLLNLILGLSRVLLAMGRRGDAPKATSRLNEDGSAPFVATIVVAVIIGGLVCIGDVKTTWTFSAFTVLIYYALTNAAALRLSCEEKLYPRWISWTGLIACLSLAFFVPMTIWLIGLGLIALGVIWRTVAQRLS